MTINLLGCQSFNALHYQELSRSERTREFLRETFYHLGMNYGSHKPSSTLVYGA